MARVADPRQTSLLDAFEPVDAPETPAFGSLKLDRELCAAMAAAIKECPLSRAEIAARMSDLTGDPVSEHMLNKWTSTSSEGWRFPAEYLPAFEEATASDLVLELIARKRGRLVMSPKEGRDAEIGRTQREIRAMQKRLREMIGGRL